MPVLPCKASIGDGFKLQGCELEAEKDRKQFSVGLYYYFFEYIKQDINELRGT